MDDNKKEYKYTVRFHRQANTTKDKTILGYEVSAGSDVGRDEALRDAQYLKNQAEQIAPAVTA